MMIMKHHNAYSAISQMPVVLIPIQFDRQIYLNDHDDDQQQSTHERIIPLTRLRSIASSFQHSVVLRAFLTKDFMTGRPAIPGETFPHEMLDEMCQTIQSNVPGISRILYDLTSKPPGSIIFLGKCISILFICFSNNRMGITKKTRNKHTYICRCFGFLFVSRSFEIEEKKFVKISIQELVKTSRQYFLPIIKNKPNSSLGALFG